MYVVSKRLKVEALKKHSSNELQQINTIKSWYFVSLPCRETIKDFYNSDGMLFLFLFACCFVF